jgi:hypothetical protein
MLVQFPCGVAHAPEYGWQSCVAGQSSDVSQVAVLPPPVPGRVGAPPVPGSEVLPPDDELTLSSSPSSESLPHATPPTSDPTTTKVEMTAHVP